MSRTVTDVVTGQPAVDGAGVRLVRVLGQRDVRTFDPFLMLDSFDTDDPADVRAGFPMHPHRGIETITYLARGRVSHRDSLGNSGVIEGGQAQWMCAGSGILHEEMPDPTGSMLGVQVWLNLPAAEKMARPAYNAIVDVPETRVGDALVRVVGGSCNGVRGFSGDHLPATFLDVQLPAGGKATLPVAAGEGAFLFLLDGDALVGERRYRAKSALALSDDGDEVGVAAPADAPARVLLLSAPRLREPVAWGGPIVMNTQAELYQAFEDLDSGTFVRERPAE